MSAKIGQLLIDIHANVAKLSQDMDKANSTVSGALNKMSSTLKKFGGAMGTYFAADKVLSFFDGIRGGLDNLNTLSSRTGVAVETLSGFQHAASVSFTKVEDVGVALGLLSQKMVDAAGGSAEAATAFQRLGVSFKNSDGSIRASDAVMLDLADKMKGLPDGAAKTGLAMKLLGESGAKLIPFLNNGKDGLEALRKEAEDLGLTVSTDTAQQATAFTDNLTRLNGVATAAGNAVMKDLLPVLIKLTDRFVNAAKQGDNLAKVVSTGFRIVATVGEVVWQIFNHVGKAIGALGAALVELVQGHFRNAYNIAKEGGGEIIGDWKTTFDNIGELWSESAEPPKKAAEKTIKAVTKITPSLQAVGKEAARMADAIAKSLLHVASINAELSTNKLDDIRQKYAGEIQELEKKINKEKIKEAEKQAYIAELAAVRRKRDKELDDAVTEQMKAYERQRRDAALETAALQATLTETQLDDIEASYAQRLEALERSLQDQELTEEEYADRRKVILLQKDKEVTAAAKAEAEKRNAEQLQIYKGLATGLSNALGRQFLNPMSEGFLKLNALLESLANIISDIITQLLVSGLEKLLVAGLTGGAGGSGSLLSGMLGFSDGGQVRGPGGPTADMVGPVMLSNDEFVIRAASAKKLGLPFLNWLNRVGELPKLRLPAFAAGGSVGGSRASAAVGGGGVNVSLTQVVQAGGGLLHRELLARELGPTLRQLAIEQVDSIVRQLGLSPAAVTSRG